MGMSRESKPFDRTRSAHRTELTEDYVEAILDLGETHGEARLTDLARKMGVAHPTVSKSLKRIEQQGYLNVLPYRSIQLTEEGKKLALRCRARHHTVVRFLISLGVGRETAEVDAEGIEHHVSEETLRAMENFPDTITPKATPKVR